MKSKKIIIGSRGSKLALKYAEKAKSELLKTKNIEDIEIKSITTKGDSVQNIRLSEYGGKGLFCKTIEEELINKKIDKMVKNIELIFSDIPLFLTKISEQS